MTYPIITNLRVRIGDLKVHDMGLHVYVGFLFGEGNGDGILVMMTRAQARDLRERLKDV